MAACAAEGLLERQAFRAAKYKASDGVPYLPCTIPLRALDSDAPVRGTARIIAGVVSFLKSNHHSSSYNLENVTCRLMSALGAGGNITPAMEKSSAGPSWAAHANTCRVKQTTSEADYIVSPAYARSILPDIRTRRKEGCVRVGLGAKVGQYIIPDANDEEGTQTSMAEGIRAMREVTLSHHETLMSTSTRADAKGDVSGYLSANLPAAQLAARAVGVGEELETASAIGQLIPQTVERLDAQEARRVLTSIRINGGHPELVDMLGKLILSMDCQEVSGCSVAMVEDDPYSPVMPAEAARTAETVKQAAALNRISNAKDFRDFVTRRIAACQGHMPVRVPLKSAIRDFPIGLYFVPSPKEAADKEALIARINAFSTAEDVANYLREADGVEFEALPIVTSSTDIDLGVFFVSNCLMGDLTFMELNAATEPAVDACLGMAACAAEGLLERQAFRAAKYKASDGVPYLPCTIPLRALDSDAPVRGTARIIAGVVSFLKSDHHSSSYNLENVTCRLMSALGAGGNITPAMEKSSPGPCQHVSSKAVSVKKLLYFLRNTGIAKIWLLGWLSGKTRHALE
ncbi:hypothetical protein FOZ63_027125 [Perkinsus olseni]|uniref:Uncharacterized protein n=1 Tax=Perkinsus olseni TaxID=32597 RepID=A0A7J6Q2T3_PEROL|nr:hypothetical protein FOZ62_027288 [Perkinsus olseni]KAF4758644.1 hypothetical protein FOZ63_027125 [Perkinsus olseni]